MNNRLYNLGKSFAYAIKGVAFCVKHERNMRIHLIAFAYVMFFAIKFYEFTRAEFLALILTCASVCAFEVMNTAIEVLTDKTTPEYHLLAKIAKDAAAGAVFISAGASIAVGVILFWDLDKFKEIAEFFIANISGLIALLASLGLSGIFIFSGKKREFLNQREFSKDLNKTGGLEKQHEQDD